jgi:hypothetical protein
MALKQAVELFGFGSHFSTERKNCNDVDLLIVHKDTHASSVRFAIRCKNLLRKAIPAVHVTMLSVDEEHEWCFKQRCEALWLGVIIEERAERELSRLAEEILTYHA